MAMICTSLKKVFTLVRNDDVDCLRTLFTTINPDLNQVNQKNITPLMLACSQSTVNSDMVELLIDKGAEVDFQNCLGDYALLKVVENGNVEGIKLLVVKHGARVDLKLEDRACMRKKSQSALDISCEQGNVEVVKALLEGPLSQNTNDIEYSVSCSPFNAAVKHKCIKLVEWFLKNDKVNDTPVDALFPAIESQINAMVRLLLEYGAQVNPTADGETSALMLASFHGNSEIVKMLLERDAIVDLQNKRKVSALIIAASEGKVEVVKQLLEGGADVNLKGMGGSTALLSVLSAEEHVVPQQSKVAIVKLLLERGADVKVQDNKCHTPLNLVIDLKSVEIVKLLLDKDRGAIINQPDEFGGYSLKRALLNCSQPAIVQSLLDAGADVSLQGGIILTYVRDSSVAKLLIEKGAKINVQDDDGAYPLFNAARHDNCELVALLLENGADSTILTDDGKSAESILKRKAEKRLVQQCEMWPQLEVSQYPSYCRQDNSSGADDIQVIDKEVTSHKLNVMKWRAPSGEEKVLRLKEEMSVKWRELGQNVGISDARLTDFRSMYLNSNEECMNAVTQKWMQMGINQEYPANWKGLIKLLKDVELNNLADKILEAAADPGSDL